MSQRSCPQAMRSAAPVTDGRARNKLMVGIAAVVFTVAAVMSLWFGSNGIAPGTVVGALFAFDPADSEHLIIVESRVPRLVLGVAVGLALGMAGGVMQSLTRNPLADPGVFGINSGAAVAVVAAITWFGATSVSQYIWFAFGGATIAAAVVFTVGAAHRESASSGRLVLAGAAFSMSAGSLTAMLLLGNDHAFQQFRFWTVGSLQGRDMEVVFTITPFIVAGALLALALAGPLNALSLDDDSARSVGASLPLIRCAAGLSVILLAGAATAAAGPIAFVGLAAPHIVRAVLGPDNRRVLPGIAIAAPILLVVTDAIGKIAAAPQDLQTGIATALFGGPLLIALVRSSAVVRA
ncbi:FecCD family ABC transporter permease [Corynebacterium freneyi]|uniref:FecCD family ABC transporter permease n=1 Tax=Corynebacterium freneyi TaxID=134034 RepID=UPI001EF3D0D7|nr:iron ABC transporter permease [Corynebacterium freneyi]MCG7438233.1 iron ABC transporter permease [Corynebacterium freneyi]